MNKKILDQMATDGPYRQYSCILSWRHTS